VSSLDAETRRMIEANRVNWDNRTPIHVRSAFYGLDGSRPASYWFADFEWADLGELSGADVLQLQCHVGAETIAFPGRGAKTVGLDISGESIAAARRIARDAGVDIEYVQSDVYDAHAALGGRSFDVVYTSKGAVFYLPDLPLWAEVVAGLLRPGGVAYVVDFHPLLVSLGPVPPPDGSEDLVLRYDYLNRGPVERDATYTYTDGPPLSGGRVAYEWLHGIGEVINAFVDAGLRIERVRESDRIPWPRWSSMIPTEDGWFRLPDSAPRIPLLYAVLARKP
jgi:SAM-dependent methyltransferase